MTPQQLIDDAILIGRQQGLEAAAEISHEVMRDPNIDMIKESEEIVSRIRALVESPVLPEQQPFAYFQRNPWGNWEEVMASAAGEEGVVAAYRAPVHLASSQPERSVPTSEFKSVPELRAAFESAHRASMTVEVGEYIKNGDGSYAVNYLNQQFKGFCLALQSGISSPAQAARYKLVPISSLIRIAGLIDPSPIVDLEGRQRVFVNPNAAATLTRLSAEIRELLVAPQPGEPE
jgi:hypothetical protein